MTDIPALLPCPFCGYSSITVSLGDLRHLWFAQCERCQSDGPMKPTKAEAVTAWNTRSLTTALEIGLAMQREADAKIAENGIADYEAQQDSWERAFGKDCAHPYDERIDERREIATAIRSTPSAVDLEGLTERLAWTIHTATGRDLDPDDWIHLDPAIKEQRRTEARAVLGPHAREN